MDWLLDNLLADMPGPTFLLLYAAVILVTIGATAAVVHRIDRRSAVGAPIIPHKLDPYEMAYLRAGVTEVIRVAGFNALRAGTLQVVPVAESTAKSCGRRSPWRLAAVVDGYALHDVIDKEIHRFCSDKPCTPEDLLRPEVIQRMEALCAPYRRSLLDRRLLTPAEIDKRRLRVLGYSLTLVLAVGGYKLSVALMKGHYNVGFLLLLAAAAVAALSFICRPRRVTKSGHAYVGRVRQAYKHLRRPESDADSTLSAGIFGLHTLSGTPYGGYSDVFTTHTSTSSSGASSSPSCSGGSGGGCGGYGGGGG